MLKASDTIFRTSDHPFPTAVAAQTFMNSSFSIRAERARLIMVAEHVAGVG